MSLFSRLFRSNSKQALAARAAKSEKLVEPAVVFLGAGATVACGGPSTNEILPRAFKLARLDEAVGRNDFTKAVQRFLEDNFNLPHKGVVDAADYPPLPLLLSLIDTALEKEQRDPDGKAGRFREPWVGERLRTVRHGLEYLTFCVLEKTLDWTLTDTKAKRDNPHLDLLTELRRRNQRPTFISLNYDIIIDNSLRRFGGVLPDYRCKISTRLYEEARGQHPDATPLLKLHGSTNWIYCPACRNLHVAISDDQQYFIKAARELYQEAEFQDRYTSGGAPCPDCKATLRPIMITPTQRKDYENPHIATVWERAAEALSEAQHIYMIGYSLPPEDVDVIYLLKGNIHLPPDRIHVIDWDPKRRRLGDHPAGKGYRSLFGNNVDWHPEGFTAYVAGLAKERA